MEGTLETPRLPPKVRLAAQPPAGGSAAEPGRDGGVCARGGGVLAEGTDAPPQPCKISASEVSEMPARAMRRWCFFPRMWSCTTTTSNDEDRGEAQCALSRHGRQEPIIHEDEEL